MSGPIIDPVAFPRRYLSAAIPSAAAMGPEGAILCHVLFSWAASYGVNERGELDVPEGGGGADETERETQREMRRRNTQSAIRIVLKEIDEAAIMRKPSWDGVRCMLMVLPLTEGGFIPSIADTRCGYSSGKAGNVRMRRWSSLQFVLFRCHQLRWPSGFSISCQRWNR